LLHVRENADEIAITRHEDRAATNLSSKLAILVANLRRTISVNRNLAFFTMGYSYLIQLIPYLIVAPLFISETAEFGVITQSVVAFAQLMGAFSLIVTQFQSISTYSAVVFRLGRLMDGFEEASASDASLVNFVKNGDAGFEGLSLLLENGTPVLRELSFRLPAGKWLLIDGHSEPAKRVLFRAMAGISGNGTGHVILPEGEAAYVPERPYLHSGPLRENLVGESSTISDDQILETLRELELESLAARGLDQSLHWDKELSMSTQQLLVIARVLLSGSQVIILDHLLSSLTHAGMLKVFSILRARQLTCFCFGSGEEEIDPFDYVLRVDSEGSWNIESPSSTS
jgi:putative ATP-binding cassette transporter